MGGLTEGQKVLIIRYGKKKDCIEKHQEVLDKIGYCWFGKIGFIPSSKVIAAIQEERNPAIVLYSQGNAYLCRVSDVAYEKPEEGFPEYYVTELFDELVFPKSYYKILSIEMLYSDDLQKMRIVSSGSLLNDTLNRSMSSFFFAEYGKAKLEILKRKTEQKHERKKKSLDQNDCIYRKKGICDRKGFVNYKYECERPCACVGQKY